MRVESLFQKLPKCDQRFFCFVAEKSSAMALLGRKKNLTLLNFSIITNMV